MRNRWAKDCEECGTYVEEGEGHVTKEDGEWVTRCESCFEEVEPTICVTMHPDKTRAKVQPDSHLGDVLFHEYRQACAEAGTKYSAAIKANIATMETLPRLIKELKACNFLVSVADDVIAALDSYAKAARTETDSAKKRLNEVNAKLAERGESLFGYQEDGVQWLAPRTAAILGDDMGLGKTVQALVSIPENTPILVICPAVAKGVWLREAKRWRPDLEGEALKGRGSFRWPKAGEMVIINYDILPDVDKAEIRKRVRKDCPEGVVIIGDEAQALKNNKAKRTKRFRSLKGYALKRGGKVWLLTATPLMNKPVDLWNILQAADLAAEAYSNWETFCELFNGEKGRWGGYEWGKPSNQSAKRLRRVMLRREKRDVLKDLPAKIYNSVTVEIDKKTFRLADDIMTMVADAGIDLAAAVAEANDAALRGIAFEEMSSVRSALAAAKIPHLIKMVEEFEEAEEPLIVFSAHRAPIDSMAGRDGWAVITGDTPPSKRTDIEDAFQAGKLKGVAATIQAGGTAITLTRSSNMIFVDKDWTPALNSQAEDRACRIGQTRGVQIISLVAAHPLDESVHELLARKQVIISGSVEASRRTEVRESRADKLEEAASNIADLASEAARELAERDEAAEARRSERAQSRSKAPKKSGSTARREAKNVSERWAQQALGQLVASDADMARDRNGVGFNRTDGPFGHSLAAQLSSGAGLTDKQWRAAIKLCTKYKRQVGECPAA